MTRELLGCVPFLRVADLDRSRAFYCDALGFAIEWVHQFEPGLPRVAALARDGVRLFLTEHPEAPSGSLVYIYARDVDALALAASRSGLPAEFGPADQPWGLRELHLRDPDGNALRFGQRSAIGPSES